MPVPRLFGPSLALAVTLAIVGCSGIDARNPSWLSAPPEAPPRPEVQPAFPSVYETPAPRPTKLMSEQELATTEADLAAARDRVNAAQKRIDRDR